MRWNKSASMQLSINAIVILVMAMAVLGIGLGLIRGVLAPAQENLEEALGKVDLSETATSTKVIANLPKTVRMKNGADNQVAISYYNTGGTNRDACATTGAVFRFQCGGVAFDAETAVLSVPVNIGEAQTLIGSFKPTDGQSTVPCKVEVFCSAASTYGEISGTAVDTAAVFVDFSS